MLIKKIAYLHTYFFVKPPFTPNYKFHKSNQLFTKLFLREKGSKAIALRIDNSSSEMVHNCCWVFGGSRSNQQQPVLLCIMGDLAGRGSMTDNLF